MKKLPILLVLMVLIFALHTSFVLGFSYEMEYYLIESYSYGQFVFRRSDYGFPITWRSFYKDAYFFDFGNLLFDTIFWFLVVEPPVITIYAFTSKKRRTDIFWLVPIASTLASLTALCLLWKNLMIQVIYESVLFILVCLYIIRCINILRYSWGSPFAIDRSDLSERNEPNHCCPFHLRNPSSDCARESDQKGSGNFIGDKFSC